MEEVVVRLESDDFVQIYRADYRRLVRVLELAGAESATAEDLAQEAFARTLARWRRVRAGTNPAGYVYRVAFRLWSRDRHRRGRPVPTVGVGRTDITAEAAVTRADAEWALAAMPPRQRTCTIMCLVLGYTPADAAEVMRIKASTVRKHLEHARADLCVHLEVTG